MIDATANAVAPIDLQTDSFRAEVQAHLGATNDAVDDANAKAARVHLLFGDQSEAGTAATALGPPPASRARRACFTRGRRTSSTRPGHP